MRHPANAIMTDLRQAFSHFLYGNGIEIGALHQPLPLKGTRVQHIRYVDRMSNTQLRSHYPELASYSLVQVDVIDDGETLSTIDENSLDFIIANHFIEHTRDPIGTIQTWSSKLKVGGVIYMAVPDKRYTFDVERPLTKIEHLVRDTGLSEQARRELDLEHYREFAKHVNKKTGQELEAQISKLIETDYSIHFHTFTGDYFLELISFIQMELKAPLKLLGYADAIPGNIEFIVVLSRIK
jgi:SAM-dependent methyltransferase